MRILILVGSLMLSIMGMQSAKAQIVVGGPGYGHHRHYGGGYGVGYGGVVVHRRHYAPHVYVAPDYDEPYVAPRVVIPVPVPRPRLYGDPDEF